MTKKEIHRICKQYGIKNYTINDDMSIDVNGDVRLYNWRLEKLPLKFNKVSGNFNCAHNKLISLQGGPTIVGGNFYCYDNVLSTLENCPEFVGGVFYCIDNPIYKEFRDRYNLDYKLYLKYIKRQKILKQLVND